MQSNIQYKDMLNLPLMLKAQIHFLLRLLILVLVLMQPSYSNYLKLLQRLKKIENLTSMDVVLACVLVNLLLKLYVVI
jgi:hypothetical protein